PERHSRADAGNRHSEIFGGGELDKQLWNLEGTGDAQPRCASWRAFADVNSVEPDRAAVGFEIAGDHVDKGGLAGAVGADQADFLTGWNIERERIGRNHRAKALVELAHRKNRVHGAAPRSVVSGAVAGIRRLRRSLIHSEPMPRGRNRMTPRRKTPST